MSAILEETNLNKSDKKQFRKVVVSLFFILVFIISIVTYSIYYIDPINGCFITIEEDIVGGNKNGIIKALNYLKVNDKPNYLKTCRNVNTIIEKYCYYMESRIRTNEQFIRQGCYITGSKAIYILPSKYEDIETTKARANDIVKYATFSESYWKYKD